MPATAAARAGKCQHCGYEGGGQSSYAGMLITEHFFGEIDAASGTDHHTDASPGVHWIYSLSPACLGNLPGDEETTCDRFLTFCQRTKGQQADFEDVSRAAAGTNNWRRLTRICVGPSDVRDPDQVRQDIDVRVAELLRLTPPTIASAPPTRFLTNLPSDFWAEAPPGQPGSQASPKRVTVSMDDVSVTLTATATWRWDFGDGTDSATSRTAGVPYDATYDPRVTPEHYTGDGVLHTYHQSGDYTADLTVTWRPSYVLTYQFGEWDQTPVVYNVARPLQVKDARAVLVLGDG